MSRTAQCRVHHDEKATMLRLQEAGDAPLWPYAVGENTLTVPIPEGGPVKVRFDSDDFPVQVWWRGSLVWPLSEERR